MLRAQYDTNGNIILGNAKPPEGVTEHAAWTVVEEQRTSIVRTLATTAPVASVPKKNPVKTILVASATETKRQYAAAKATASREISAAITETRTLPERLSHSMRAAWSIANTPVTLPGRKPGKRAPKKMTLFVVDTVRFGGTFALIFGLLFVSINYQSFWQIARAQLALEQDYGTEQALSTLGQTPPSLPSGESGFGGGAQNINILKYLPSVGPLEDRIIIPKLGKNIPIVRPSMDALMREDWTQFENDIQSALRGGVVHYPGSARPGQAGNFFVTGHSSYYPWDSGQYKDVFARLHELETGDTYSVYYGGDRHTYRITRKYEVKPSDVSVLDQPSDKRIAMLMTCTPIGTTLRRLIVEAEEIDPVTGVALLVGEKVADKPVSPFARPEMLPI